MAIVTTVKWYNYDGELLYKDGQLWHCKVIQLWQGEFTV